MIDDECDNQNYAVLFRVESHILYLALVSEDRTRTWTQHLLEPGFNGIKVECLAIKDC